MMVSAPQVEALLPHRHPFLFVDRIVSLVAGQSAQGLFVINDAHPFINRNGDRPVFPSFLLVEALGQMAALAVRPEMGVASSEPRRQGYLVRVDACRFDRAVYVGDTVMLSARRLAGYGPLHKFDAHGEVAGEPVVQASVTLYLGT
ncbi:MAG TPA: hypothetical protein DCE18_07110 [Syntrophobacteraceae bacterium]|nr:hypothetical protein [Syntrophobacteraceae bacterium]